MVYKFRVILDVKEDVFRDIIIQEDATLEDFHNVINQSFGFTGEEMASFYLTDDDWNQGEEITLFDVSESGETRLMEETTIDEVVSEDNPKLLYIYDFMQMWTFFVNLVEIDDERAGASYPMVLNTVGSIPAEAPEKNFVADDLNEFEDEFNDFDVDEEDYYEGFSEEYY